MDKQAERISSVLEIRLWQSSVSGGSVLRTDRYHAPASGKDSLDVHLWVLFTEKRKTISPKKAFQGLQSDLHQHQLR